MKYIYSLIKLGLGIPKFWALNPITFLQCTTLRGEVLCKTTNFQLRPNSKNEFLLIFAMINDAF